MTHKEYNGWTNYETWLVKLWMDNEEFSSRYKAVANDPYTTCACAEKVRAAIAHVEKGQS